MDVLKSYDIVLTANVREIEFGKQILKEIESGPASVVIKRMPPWMIRLDRDEHGVLRIITLRDGMVIKTPDITK